MTDFTGQDFDRYHILASLGEGGMASVYKAYDTRLERDVAVKIIRTDMFVPATLQSVLKRFEREAKSLGKLSHPNIVSIIDYGEHDGVPYLVMEYLPGGTLKDRLKGPPLSWQEATHLLLPIGRALQFSHQQGIIHRDVKPSNILITLSGEPMLSDFGIAKILESEGNTTLTGTGVGIGTPEYMAPEQWIGNTSPQSDLYSMGVVLYEMVTARKPFTAETPAALLLKQANDPLPRPRLIVPDLPDKVEKVILKALAKKPENRYSSMQEFVAALEDLLSGQNKIKQPAFPWEKRKVEKNQLPEPEILTVQQPVEDQPTVEVRLPSEGEPVESGFQAKASTKTILQPPGIPVIEALRRVKIKIRPAWSVALVGLVAVIALAIWGMSLRKAGSVPTSVSGSYVYFTSDQSGKAEVYYLDSQGKLNQVTHTPGRYESWSPVLAAGGYVYFTSNQSGKVEIYCLDSHGKLVQFTHTPGQYESWSAVPAAGGYVYFTSNQSGKVEIYFLDSNGKLVQFTHSPGQYESWSAAPAAGGYVYFTSNQSGKAEVYYLDLKGKLVQLTHTSGQYESWSPVLGNGGITYFTSNQSGKAEIYFLDSNGKLVQFTHTPGQYKSWVSLSIQSPGTLKP